MAGIDRANRRADHEIWQHSGGHQHAQHADLYRSKAPPTSKDKCGFFSKPIHGRRSFRVSIEPRLKARTSLELHLLLALLREENRRGFVTGDRRAVMTCDVTRLVHSLLHWM